MEAEKSILQFAYSTKSSWSELSLGTNTKGTEQSPGVNICICGKLIFYIGRNTRVRKQSSQGIE